MWWFLVSPIQPGPWSFELPQGAIQGTLLYNHYTADLSHVLSLPGVAIHQYAADAKRQAVDAFSLAEKMFEALYAGGHPTNSGSIPLKTQLRWLGSRWHFQRIGFHFLQFHFPDASFSNSVHDLGEMYLGPQTDFLWSCDGIFYNVFSRLR